MFLDLLSEYRIQHGADWPLYVTSSYSTWIFCRGVSGFATDCPCGVWCRELTTCLLHVGPPFGNWILKQQLGCRFDIMDNIYYFFVCVLTYAIIYVLIHQIFFGITFLNILNFFKYSCINIFHRRSLYTFYGIVNRRICVLRGPTELMAVRLCQEDKHCSNNMMTSSNGNISRVTGHLCGEFTGQRWISRSKASDAELWFFLSSGPE